MLCLMLCYSLFMLQDCCLICSHAIILPDKLIRICLFFWSKRQIKPCISVFLSFIQEVVDFGTVLFWTDNELFIGGGRITSRRAKGTYKELLFQVNWENRFLTAAFGSDPSTVGILVKTSNKLILLISNHQTRQIHSSSFLESGVSPENMPRGLLHMRFYESAKETLLLWNQTALWYSFRDNSQWGMLKVPGFHSLGSAVPGKNIHEVMLGEATSFV